MKTLQKKLKLSKGEVREELLERQDLSVLDASASRIENFISTPFGGAKTRDGTENIDEVATNLLKVTQPSITSEVGGTPNNLYNETDYYESLGIENATLLILYDWNLGVTVPDELVAYWKFDEVTGNALDSFASYDLNEVGTVGSATGKLGTARGTYAPGTDFNYGTSGPFNANHFMIHRWIKVPSSGSTKVICGTSNDQSLNGWSYHVLSTGKLRIRIDGVTAGIDSTTSVDTDEWVFIVMIRYGNSAGQTRIYVNDNFEASGGNNAAMTAGAGAYKEGVQNNNSNAFTGGYFDEGGYLDLVGSSNNLAYFEGIATDLYNSGVGKKYSV